MTIRAVLIFNNYGRPRLTKFYSHLPTDRQQTLIQLIFQIVSRRDENAVCNFLDAPELTPFLPPTTWDAWSRLKTTSSLKSDEQEDVSSDFDPWLDYEDDLSTEKLQYHHATHRWRPDDELRVIYRHYATLYFVLVVDQSESELGILDLIQVLVEALDESFENVCELDLIFHFEEVHAIVDQIVQGGLVLETNLGQIVTAVQAVRQAYKAPLSSASSISSLPGSLASSLSSTWSPLSLGHLADRGTDTLDFIQQFGSQYWHAIQSNAARPSGMRSRFS